MGFTGCFYNEGWQIASLFCLRKIVIILQDSTIGKGEKSCIMSIQEKSKVIQRGKKMQKQIRAAKGGESGINGLWYNGGTFMPATVLPKLTRGSTPANGEEFKQSERKSEGLPVMEAGRKSSLIKELGALLADRLLPEARRPGREMFDAGWLFRNVTPALERGSREFEITKELSKYQ